MQLLGHLSTKTFLSQFWQKRPLLVRQAIPGFAGLVQASELLALATRDNVESRLVSRRRGAWHLRYGPFARAETARLPTKNWTILVQGLNQVVPAADALLRRFRFIPYARLDDVMASYAVPGGGVGPHVDSYDVFLLQGPGRRRWSVGRPRRWTLDPKAPLKILREFRPQASWQLEPGDLLYLPPGWGHEGVALEPSSTYSIGFRAPSDQEIAGEFLAYLQDRIELDGLYADPGLRLQRHPAAIPARMVRHAATVTRRVRWKERDVGRFLGEYLSTPKPQVLFLRPRRRLSPGEFARRSSTRGLRLDLRTQMLFRNRDFFINGERIESSARTRAWLERLADQRSVPPISLPETLLPLLHSWFLAGWIRLGDRDA
jgi:50S ribosomal protein L16 3-hydroxylase